MKLMKIRTGISECIRKERKDTKMAFYINPVKKFADSVVFTKPPYKGRYQQNIRDSLFVHKMFKNGMAQV